MAQISGESVEVVQSAVGSVTGATVSLRQSAVRQLAAEQASLTESAAGLVRGHEVGLRESAALVAFGQSVSVEGSRVAFLLSPRVSGPVTAVFTLPAAFALGVGFVVGRAVLRAMSRLPL